MNDKYWMFRKFMDFVNDYSDVTYANMINYAGDIEIVGKTEDGTKITVRVSFEEGENNGKSV